MKCQKHYKNNRGFRDMRHKRRKNVKIAKGLCVLRQSAKILSPISTLFGLRGATENFRLCFRSLGGGRGGGGSVGVNCLPNARNHCFSSGFRHIHWDGSSSCA